MEFSPDLVPVVMDAATGLDARIANMRNHIATEYGLILPEIRLTDNPGLPAGSYAIRVQGSRRRGARSRPTRCWCSCPTRRRRRRRGATVAEPVYGAPRALDRAGPAGGGGADGPAVVTPTEVVATHLLEIVKAHFGRLFNRRALRKLLDEFVSLSDPRRAEANRRILDEFVPDKFPIDMLQAVLRLLLEERVSIRNLPLIFEAIGRGLRRRRPARR